MAKDAGFGSGGGIGSASAALEAGGGGGEGGAPDVAALVQQSVAPQMGAGGTSSASSPDAKGGSPMGMGGGGDSAGKNLAATAAAVPVAAGIAQLMFLMMILNWLKMMFMAVMAAVGNFISMVIGAVVAVAKVAVGAAMAVGGAISSVVGGAISATAGAVTAGVTAVSMVAVGASIVVTGATGATAQRDGALFDCSSEVVAASLVQEKPVEGENSEQTLKNAKMVYGVLSAWGMPDENIAGILGNWDAESGIDSTGVETVGDEPFSVGNRKKAAEAAGFDAASFAPEYVARFPGVKLLGIGLGQWSNDRNTQLTDYAKSAGKSWSTFEVQLGFMISKDSGAPVIKDMIANAKGSPGEAAVFFHNEWERSADTALDHRKNEAAKWFAQMSGWEKDQSLADSILKQSGSTVDDANVARVVNAKANCLTDNTAVNAGLKQGGLTLEEATAYMAKYRTEGEGVLQAAFNGGGPGTCSGGQADNCVGFSSYFIYQTTDVKGYVGDMGVGFAKTSAGHMGLPLSTTPTVYSIFSTPVMPTAGHTGVVLGIDGDDLIIGEASCGSNHAGTRAYRQPISGTSEWSFVDISPKMTADSLK